MNENIELMSKLEALSKKMRVDAIKMAYAMGSVGAHIGGGLSLVEIMAVLYCGIMKIKPHNMKDEKRDRLIFSKGHGTLALYPAMHYAGLITEEELYSYKKNETFLFAHPSMYQEKGIEFSSGSLGQGLSLGVGTCLALTRKNNTESKVYVVLGDGECNEGSVWEAAQSAAHFRCNQLIAVVDKNQLQYDGATHDIMDEKSMKMKWESFGWKVIEVDGHSVSQLYEALSTEVDKPLVIIANTVKGKGVSFMENNPLWHNHSLTEQQYQDALDELEKEEVKK